MKKTELHPLKVAVLEEKMALEGEPRGQSRKTEGNLTRKSIYFNMVLEKIDLIEKAENNTLKWLKDIEHYVKELGKMQVILFREATPSDDLPSETPAETEPEAITDVEKLTEPKEILEGSPEAPGSLVEDIPGSKNTGLI